MAESLETQHPVKAFGWAARDSSGIFSPIKFSRRPTGEHDVQLKVLYCGLCYSEVHLCKNEWGSTNYPLIPGHEFTGVVTEVGSKVKKFKPGDKVGIATLVGSCRECDQCVQGETSYCAKQIFTINDHYYDGSATYGGFSNIMVADEHFVFRWPENFPQDKGAPLLCAGITSYSPLRHHGLDKPGVNVGVVGLGGLGHLAVKFAKALGCRVTVISTSNSKKKEAFEKFGVDEFLISTDQEQMKAAQSTLDGIIDTATASHDLQPLLDLLKPHCKLILVGLPTKLEIPIFPLILGGKSIVGSASAGVKQVQEMIDFAAEHNILPEVEIIPMDYVNTAIERLEKNDVKYRFVIDVGNTLKAE